MRLTAPYGRDRHVILDIRRPGSTKVACAVAAAAPVFVEGIAVPDATTAVRTFQGVAAAIQALPSGPKAASMGARASVVASSAAY